MLQSSALRYLACGLVVVAALLCSGLAIRQHQATQPALDHAAQNESLKAKVDQLTIQLENERKVSAAFKAGVHERDTIIAAQIPAARLPKITARSFDDGKEVGMKMAAEQTKFEMMPFVMKAKEADEKLRAAEKKIAELQSMIEKK